MKAGPQQGGLKEDVQLLLMGFLGATPQAFGEPDVSQLTPESQKTTLVDFEGVVRVMSMAASHVHHVCDVSGNCIERISRDGDKPSLEKREMSL